MKTKEELNALKKEVDTSNKKLEELTEEELEQVSGGNSNEVSFACGDWVDSENFQKISKSTSYAYQVTEVNGDYLTVQEYFFLLHTNFYRTGRIYSNILASSCWHVDNPNWI